MFYVYVHRKLVSGEVFYVGKGTGRRAWKKDRDNTMWKRISAKYGCVVEIVIDGLQEWAAFEIERDLIALHGMIGSGGGTLANLTDGGEGASGAVRSAETRAKIAAANIGKKLSYETKSRISAAKIGRTHSMETRAKLSIAWSGIKHPSIGRRWSAEEREAMSNSRKGKRSERHPWIGKTGDLHNSSKAVVCIETGVRYGSVCEAHRTTGVGRTGISLVLSGRQKTAGGFGWRFS